MRASTSIAQVLRGLGLKPAGGNYSAFHMHVERLGLDLSHFTGSAHRKGSGIAVVAPQPLWKLLVRGSTAVNKTHLKRRILREGLLLERCAICGIKEWQGRPLCLRLDHVNGVNDDFRLANLRLICPNCDSQLPTYCGRAKKGRRHYGKAM